MPPEISDTNGYLSIFQLRRIIGTYATALLCKAFGGRENIYIPKSSSSEHPFRDVIGDLAFGRLVEAAGAFTISLPMAISAKKADVMLVLEKGGMTNLEVATRFKVTERYVRMVRSEMRRYGIECPTPGRNPSGRQGVKKRAILHAYEIGIRDAREIATRAKTSPSYVGQVLSNHGISLTDAAAPEAAGSNASSGDFK